MTEQDDAKRRADYAQLEKDKKESADRDRARLSDPVEVQKKYDAEQEAYLRMLVDAPRTRVQAVITSLTHAQPADAVSATATLTAGSLAFVGALPSVTFSGALNGLDQTFSTTQALDVGDGTGSGPAARTGHPESAWPCSPEGSTATSARSCTRAWRCSASSCSSVPWRACSSL